MFVDAGMSAAAQRSFYDYRDEQLTDRRAVITTAFVTSTGVSALAAAAIYAARDPLATGSSRGNRIPASSRWPPSHCHCSQSRT